MSAIRFLRQKWTASFFAWLTVAFLLLPALLAIIPSSATAAERAFYADLGGSNCLDLGAGGKGKMPSHDGSQCCILCTASAPPLPPAPEQDAGLRPQRKPVVLASTLSLVVTRATLSAEATEPITSRGPPA